MGLGEVAEKVSAHSELLYGCWKLSRLLLLSVLFPTFSLLLPNLALHLPNVALQLPNLTLQIPNLVQVRIMESPSWVMGEEGSVIGE